MYRRFRVFVRPATPATPRDRSDLDSRSKGRAVPPGRMAHRIEGPPPPTKGEAGRPALSTDGTRTRIVAVDQKESRSSKGGRSHPENLTLRRDPPHPLSWPRSTAVDTPNRPS